MAGEQVPSDDDHTLEKAIAVIARVDAFHRPDACEALEAAIAAVEGWKTL